MLMKMFLVFCFVRWDRFYSAVGLFCLCLHCRKIGSEKIYVPCAFVLFTLTVSVPFGRDFGHTLCTLTTSGY